MPGFQRRERSFPVVGSLALWEFLLETHPRVPVSGLSTTALILSLFVKNSVEYVSSTES